MIQIKLFASRAALLAQEASKIHDSIPREAQPQFRDAIDHLLQAKSHFQASAREEEEAGKKGAA
jgi:hypothetical protein